MNKVVILLFGIISYSSIALSNCDNCNVVEQEQEQEQEQESKKSPYEVFLACQDISTKQYNKSMELCSKRWKTEAKERCAERVERVFEVAMQRCDKLLEKCDNW